jgi:hypothetical protein
MSRNPDCCCCCCCPCQAASKLALTMSQYLKALTLDSATSRDVAPSAMAAAHQAAAPSTAGASRGPSSAGPLSRSSAVSTADTDAGEPAGSTVAEPTHSQLAAQSAVRRLGSDVAEYFVWRQQSSTRLQWLCTLWEGWAVLGLHDQETCRQAW